MKFLFSLATLQLLLAMHMGSSESEMSNGQQCPSVIEALGVIDLPFNPAFLRIEEFDDESRTSLVVTSFFNIAALGPPPAFTCLKRDLVARIPNIDEVDADNAGFEDVVHEELTDLDSPPCENTSYPPAAPTDTIWPNDGIRAKDGVFPFEALVIPQVFINSPIPGRLTAINLDDPDRQEYILHQSSATSPRFYHDIVFYDIDNDGLEDIVSVRSGFSPPLNQFSPIGELVWFKNPGTYDPAVEWEEHLLYGNSEPPFFQFGPDIALKAYDFNGDGVPEFVATSFFQQPMQGFPETSAFTPKISIYGIPDSVSSWADVDARNITAPQAKVAVISDDQGFPLEIELVDVNGDGKIDILATNHQNSLNWPMVHDIPGRVYVLEQPSDDGDIFTDPWMTRILMDDIRPMDTLPGARGSRLAPGHAVSFHLDETSAKPWIVVGGDEAGKVWLLTPSYPTNKSNWEYDNKVIFDINVVYGANTTQTILQDPAGVSISTIGRVAVMPLEDNAVIVYIPVFEATDVHVYRISSYCVGDDKSGATKIGSVYAVAALFAFGSLLLSSSYLYCPACSAFFLVLLTGTLQFISFKNILFLDKASMHFVHITATL